MTQTILLVEDRSPLAEQICASLTEHGYCVLSASNAAEGMAKIVTERPALLIIGLPIPETFAMLRHLQSGSQFPQIPVIMMLREKAQNADIFRGWDLGVDAYVGVPLNYAELIVFVKRIFRSLDEDLFMET